MNKLVHKSILYNNTAPFVGALLTLLIWQVSATFLDRTDLLPTATQSIEASINMLMNGYWEDLLTTSARATGGWILSLVFGVPIGLLVGSSILVSKMTHGVLAFGRSIPAFVLILIPIALGIGGEISRIGTIAISSALIVIDACAVGMQNIGRERIELARSLGATRFQVLTKITFFEVLGSTVVPVSKTTINICLIVTVVVESFSIPKHGIGSQLLAVMSGVEMASVFGFILLVGLTGIILNSGVKMIADHFVGWNKG